MRAGGRAPASTKRTREHQKAGSGGGLEPLALAEILRKDDGRRDEMWGYLREVDATSAENLKGFEAFLELVYRLIRSGVPTWPSAREAVVDAANRTLTQIDATKTASRVLRRVAEASRVLRRAAESAAAPPGTDIRPLSPLGADADEHTMTQPAAIHYFDPLRILVAGAATVF